MKHIPEPSYRDPAMRFDAGIKIEYPGHPTIIRISKGTCYVVEEDLIVRCVKHCDLSKYKILCFEYVLHSSPVSSVVDLFDFCHEKGIQVHTHANMLTGYKYDEDGNIIEFTNLNLMRRLICLLEDGDSLERINELAKTVYIGQKKENTPLPRPYASPDFEQNIKLVPDVSTREDPFPYFFLTYHGTSRVDMAFCREHREEFFIDAFMKIKKIKLYDHLGLPDSAYIVERMGLARDHSIQVVIGLKHELIDVLKDVRLPLTYEEKKMVLKKALAEAGIR